MKPTGIASLIATLLSVWIAQAGSPENWTIRAPTGSDIVGVTYAKGEFWAAAGHGGLLASRDGSNWSVRDLGEAQTPNSYIADVGYGNGLYVAVGTKGFLATSSDGVEWTARETSVVAGLGSVAYGNGRFVVVGGGGRTRAILTSEDGIRWIVRELSDKGNLWQVIFAQDKFVAAGNLGAILTSWDGIEWRESIPSRADRLSGVAFGNGRFVVVGDYESFTSSNGFTWTRLDSGIKGSFLSVAFGDKQFVVAGNGNAWRSPDGLAWTLAHSGVISNPLAITFGDGKFVSVGGSGFVAISSNGVNWVSGSPARNILFEKVAGGGGLLLATGLTSIQVGPNAWQMTTPLVSSRDGSVWTDLEFFTNYQPISVDYAGSQFIVFARDKQNPDPVFVLTSSDGTNWQRTDLNSTGAAKRVLYADGKFLGVGGGIFHSTDGQSWTVQAAPTVNTLMAVAHGNGRYVACESTGMVYISPDGMNWTRQPDIMTGFSDIVFANGQFVATAYKIVTIITPPTSVSYFRRGLIATSADGEKWNLHETPASAGSEGIELRALAFGGGWFVAVGAAGSILISSDGMQWTAVESATRESLASVAYADGRFVAVGSRGTTIVSENVLAARLMHASSSKLGFSFTVSGQPGSAYRLQRTTDLSSPWEDIETITMDTRTKVVSFPAGAPAPSQFFRVVRP